MITLIAVDDMKVSDKKVEVWDFLYLLIMNGLLPGGGQKSRKKSRFEVF
jgi:hypothetical protein